MKPDLTPNPRNAIARPFSRRRFLATTASAALAAPMILPGSARGANSRLQIGIIGTGAKGKHHVQRISDHVAALCDVDAHHLAAATKLLGREVPVFTDYRKLLERKDIDGVVIATPGHWHPLMTIHACQTGKDVYVEKPASNFVRDGRAMVDVAANTQRVVQVGSQGRCHPGGAALREFIQSGALGKITRVECWHNDNHMGGNLANMMAPPSHLDWNLWLGPLSNRSYNPDYCHRDFRWMFDIGGGQIYDRGAHVFNLISWILDLDRTGPSRVTASGNPPTEGLWDCPLNFEVTYEFENPKLTIHWAQPGVKAGDFEFGAVYHGTRGKTIVLGGDGRVFLDEQVIDFAKAEGIPHALAKGERADATNLQNWLACMQSRKEPLMDIESGHRVSSMCSLANVAWQVDRPLQWNPTSEQIENDPGANLLLASPGRGEFRI
ncbi:MAG: Gfo/Idh/MocA family oxidoreductase [Verrucomicrobiota bacterium]